MQQREADWERKC